MGMGKYAYLINAVNGKPVLCKSFSEMFALLREHPGSSCQEIDECGNVVRTYENKKRLFLYDKVREIPFISSRIRKVACELYGTEITLGDFLEKITPDIILKFPECGVQTANRFFKFLSWAEIKKQKTNKHCNMIESSINTFEVQKHLFLNAARKTLSDMNKNNIRLDDDGIIALLESAFSSGWTSAKQDTQNAVIGALSGQIRVDLAKDVAIPGENTPKVDIPDVPRERKDIDFTPF